MSCQKLEAGNQVGLALSKLKPRIEHLLPKKQEQRSHRLRYLINIHMSFYMCNI